MPNLNEMGWDEDDMLVEADLGGGGTAYYRYDSQGQRIRKVIVNGSINKERLYIGEWELWQQSSSGTVQTERETLGISDDEKTFLQLETLTIDSGSTVSIPTTNWRYQYDNHLGSACLELDSSANIISYEEYYPFGATSYHSGKNQSEVKLKRYRYCGKERDEETGLYYYGARYYAAWIGRFISIDPLAEKFPQLTPYNYAGNKPITAKDLEGLQSTRDAEVNPDKPQSVSEIENLPDKVIRDLADELNEVKEGIIDSWNKLFSSDSDEHSKKSANVSKNYSNKIKKNEKTKSTNVKNESFNKAIKIVLKNEGGWKNEPKKDKGDPTNMGISWPTFKKFSKDLLNINPTVENLKNLTEKQATKIYKKAYWDNKGFDKIEDVELAVAIYDWTITSGGAIKEIQKLLNSEFGQSVTADGAMGPNTAKAINSVTDIDKLFNRISDIRKKYYENGAEKGWFSKDYLKGLKNRVNKFGTR